MTHSKPTVMVTGAAGHLGRAVVDAFTTRGAQVVLVDRRREKLVQHHGPEDARRIFSEANLLEQDQVHAVVQQTLARFGQIDVLCNLVGGFRMGEPVHAVADSTWDFLMDTNARTVLHTARAVVPHMLERGRGQIVNVGATAAQRGAALMGAYCAAKSSVVRLTEAMSAELRERHINVNCVLPSVIDTPDNRAAMPDADPARWVSPQDLAQVVVFLASDAARAIHGAAVPVTGLS